MIDVQDKLSPASTSAGDTYPDATASGILAAAIQVYKPLFVKIRE